MRTPNPNTPPGRKWSPVQWLFRWIPRPLWEVRCQLLRWGGASIGANVRIHPSVVLNWPARLHFGHDILIGPGVCLGGTGPVVIGSHVSIAREVLMGLEPAPRGSPPGIRIGDRVWICARAVIADGVSIGSDCTITAGARIIADVAAERLAGPSQLWTPVQPTHEQSIEPPGQLP